MITASQAAAFAASAHNLSIWTAIEAAAKQGKYSYTHETTGVPEDIVQGLVKELEDRGFKVTAPWHEDELIVGW